MFGGRGRGKGVMLQLCENGEVTRYCNKRLCYFEGLASLVGSNNKV